MCLSKYIYLFNEQVSKETVYGPNRLFPCHPLNLIEFDNSNYSIF